MKIFFKGLKNQTGTFFICADGFKICLLPCMLWKKIENKVLACFYKNTYRTFLLNCENPFSNPLQILVAVFRELPVILSLFREPEMIFKRATVVLPKKLIISSRDTIPLKSALAPIIRFKLSPSRLGLLLRRVSAHCSIFFIPVPVTYVLLHLKIPLFLIAATDILLIKRKTIPRKYIDKIIQIIVQCFSIRQFRMKLKS
jgi:hypothetical protein